MKEMKKSSATVTFDVPGVTKVELPKRLLDHFEFEAKEASREKTLQNPAVWGEPYYVPLKCPSCGCRSWGIHVPKGHSLWDSRWKDSLWKSYNRAHFVKWGKQYFMSPSITCAKCGIFLTPYLYIPLEEWQPPRSGRFIEKIHEKARPRLLEAYDKVLKRFAVDWTAYVAPRRNKKLIAPTSVITIPVNDWNKSTDSYLSAFGDPSGYEKQYFEFYDSKVVMAREPRGNAILLRLDKNALQRKRNIPNIFYYIIDGLRFLSVGGEEETGAATGIDTVSYHFDDLFLCSMSAKEFNDRYALPK